MLAQRLSLRYNVGPIRPWFGAVVNLELMAKRKLRTAQSEAADLQAAVVGLPLWQLDIVELTGHNIEARGREEVNQLLRQGWRLLHIYTLKYGEDGVWRERPMAILGRLRNADERQEPPPAGGRRHG
jgi:hypothetical protein